MRPRSDIVVTGFVACCLASTPVPLSASAARVPSPVSPGSEDVAAAVEAHCPTFQWAGVPAARGYAIAVFALDDEEGAEPRLVMRANVAGDARGWTPSSGKCLERGARYAWSVAATAAGQDPEWSAPLLFEVDPSPSADEVERAVETVRRYLESTGGDAPAPDRIAPAPRSKRTLLEPAALASPTVGARSPTVVGARVASAAAAPGLGPASLSVTDQVHLGETSAFFKAGELFLWDDGSNSGNTALGRNALSSTDYNGKNTAVGRDALREAKRGATFTTPYDGSWNTAVGYQVLASNTSGYGNTAMGAYVLGANIGGLSNTGIGSSALKRNETGDRNTAVGGYVLLRNTSGSQNTALGQGAMTFNLSGNNNTAAGISALFRNTSGNDNAAVGTSALQDNETGERNSALGVAALQSGTEGFNNTALGFRAGSYTTGHDNVLIHNYGNAGESHVLRIGQSTSYGPLPEDFEAFSLDKAFIHGIRGRTTFYVDAIPVVIDGAGQLGTVSSARRTKQDIEDLDPLDDRLLALHPVSFRYRQHAANDPDSPVQFGLIADEVAEVFPELVVYDREGKPETVKYHLLSALLLAEVQRLHARLEAVEASPRLEPAPAEHRRKRRGQGCRATNSGAGETLPPPIAHRASKDLSEAQALRTVGAETGRLLRYSKTTFSGSSRPGRSGVVSTSPRSSSKSFGSARAASPAQR